MRRPISIETNNSIPTWIQLIAALVIIVVGLGCQPKDVRPGLWLSGDQVEKPVTDWTFTDDIEEIFIQTNTWYLLPHSTTIWGAEMGGDFYIGSYGYKGGDEDKKRWENNVTRNSDATLRIDGKLYAVTVTPVTEPQIISRLDDRYNEKYDMVGTFGEELPKWWYYRIAQRN
jgi:hypothetical protein